MKNCFEGCISLTDASGLTITTGASNGTDMTECFEGCTGLSGKTFYIAGYSTASSADWTDAFKGLTGVTVQVYNSCALKAAIEAGNPNVTVVFTADPAPTCE